MSFQWNKSSCDATLGELKISQPYFVSKLRLTLGMAIIKKKPNVCAAESKPIQQNLIVLSREKSYKM